MTSRDTTKPHRVLEPEEIAARNRRIIEAVKAGVALNDLRGRFGLGESSLRDICRAAGVETNARRVRMG
jgi:AcrR family transcriptional regulator